ncbi:hypothetical protein SY86_00020 [Erwinia tracheiphila]|nr:hypothetical protein SY86_00020 [Erwinia tracheiphila]
MATQATAGLDSTVEWTVSDPSIATYKTPSASGQTIFGLLQGWQGINNMPLEWSGFSAHYYRNIKINGGVMATKRYAIGNSWQKYPTGDGVLQVISGKVFVSSSASAPASNKDALIISEFLNTSAGYLWLHTAANNSINSEIVIDDGVNDAGKE